MTAAWVPTNHFDLAEDVRFTDGAWRAPDGRTLYQLLVAEVGETEATRVWNHASRLVEATPSGFPLRDRSKPAPVRSHPSLRLLVGGAS